MPRTPLIAGNWKMHGLKDALGFFDDLSAMGAVPDGREVLVCPPATLVAAAVEAASAHGIRIGGQDCHAETSGAHTGDISAAMLRDAGADYVIVGHSERRADHGEDDARVQAKAAAARGAGLTPIICVGETLEDREGGREETVVGRQLGGSIPGRFAPTEYVIAYEPVWAIGTGRTASIDDIAAMHAFIRSSISGGEQVRILYGGSVKPENAREILALDDVDGALVGGASLQADSFAAIAKSV